MKKIGTGIVLLILSFTAIAQDQLVHPAEQVVRNTTNEVLAVLGAEKDSMQLNHMVNEVILPNFDFTQMSKWTLGKEWDNLSQDKQERFKTEFQKMLVSTYATALTEFNNQLVEVKQAKIGKNKNLALVPTVIQMSTSQALEINYMMMNGEQGWKVVDMAIGGISLIKNYRASYAAQIRKEGIDALIEKLESKNTLATL